MRGFVLGLLAAVIVYAGYSWMGPDAEEEKSSGTPKTTVEEGQETPGNSDVASQGEPEGGNTEPDEPTTTLEDLEVLSRNVAENAGADGDQDRLRLAEALRRQERPDRRRADELWGQVLRHEGKFASEAAVQLLRNGSTAEVQLVGASYLRTQGPDDDGFAESQLFFGRRKLAGSEDADQVEAWRMLSDAYFATDDPKWRDRVRPELEKLVNVLLFTPRETAACTSYTVVSLDNLSKIARMHDTTVESLMWVNRLDDDRIQPGNRLKVLEGNVTIEIDKSDYRLDALLDGKYLYSTQVGLGRFDKTPIGQFDVGLRQKKPAWQPEGKPNRPYGDPENPLGERWIGFKNTTQHSGYGIHGTTEPKSIGKQSSEGCVRMLNEDVIMLYRLIPVGTKVYIRE